MTLFFLVDGPDPLGLAGRGLVVVMLAINECVVDGG